MEPDCAKSASDVEARWALFDYGRGREIPGDFHRKFRRVGHRPGWRWEFSIASGGGDSFASGFIYALMTMGDSHKAVDCGAAHGALAMTTPGDTTIASKDEVEKLMKGGGALVQR